MINQQIWIDLAKMRSDPNNRTRFSWWFPRLPSHPDIFVPKTKIIRRHQNHNLICLLDNKKPPDYDSFCNWIIKAGNEVGWPMFLRTDFLSDKHHWVKSCSVKNPQQVRSSIFKLVETSAMADLIGFPTDCWVVREQILTCPAFFAFYGHMPIVKERRYFVNDDQVICHHPYWPPEAFYNSPVSVGRWKELLDEINIETDSEIELLTKLSSLVGATLGGKWSVDWMWSEHDQRWFLIDMGETKHSYHWPGCAKE